MSVPVKERWDTTGIKVGVLFCGFMVRVGSVTRFRISIDTLLNCMLVCSAKFRTITFQYSEILVSFLSIDV